MTKVSDEVLRGIATRTYDVPLYSESVAIARELLDMRAKAAAGKWVPREPTIEMQEAAREISRGYPYKPRFDGQRLGYLQTSLIWSVMLAAAPEAEKP